jgi:hypothetical protein
MNKHKWLVILAACITLGGLLPFGGARLPAYAQTSRTFPETGKTVGGRFLEYWNQNGGLAQQGYPISDEFQETSATDGKVYTVQYFERAVFEHHPEHARPFDVLLSLLGVFYYDQKYGADAPGQNVSTDNPRHFAQTETRHTIGGAFRKYWESNGGLAQQGYPISDEFQEVDKDGVTRTVQYFERAVFEYHQEFAGTSNEALLSLLGVFYYQAKYGSGTPAPSGVTPTVVPPPDKSGLLLFYNRATGATSTGQLDNNGVYHNLRDYTLAKDWLHIVAIGHDQLFFFNPTTGDGEVDEVDEETGHISTVKSWRTTYSPYLEATHWVSPGGGVLFSYKHNAGMGYTDYIDAEGDLVGERALTGFYEKWTNIMAASNGTLLFYDSSSGYAATGKIKPDFNFVTLKEYPSYFAKSWLSFTPANDGYIIAYGNPNGAGRSLAVGQVDGDGNFYQPRPTIPFDTGWSIIASTRKGMLLFYRIDGKAETGFVDANAQYAPAQTFGPRTFPNGWTNIIGIK